LFEAGVTIHYISNITGHGWRKIMRHPGSFLYRMIELPPVPLVLQFLVEKANLDIQEAYGSLNMGAGFAIFVPAADVEKTIAISEQKGIKAYKSGSVEEGKKQVVIEPLNIVYEEKSLNLRA
jgi:phosphoribosylformylglycinamidine cyclo-ligase